MWCGYEVTYVSNVTDVDDNIIARAQRDGTTEPELARKYEAEFWRQFDRLNILRPSEMPRATEWIAPMQKLIAELVGKGHAYVIEGEGVYFQVDSLPEYGGLSHRSLDELLESAGARVEVDERKRSPVDFAVWKASKPGEPCWESPWGDGRPGWHIECTAMALGAPRRRVRPARRRPRPRVPAPRERAGPGARRRSRVRTALDPQRDAQRQRREDVEVVRQLHDLGRRARSVRPSRLPHARAEDALPPADGDRREGARRRGKGCRDPRLAAAPRGGRRPSRSRRG